MSSFGQARPAADVKLFNLSGELATLHQIVFYENNHPGNGRIATLTIICLFAKRQ